MVGVVPYDRNLGALDYEGVVAFPGDAPLAGALTNNLRILGQSKVGVLTAKSATAPNPARVRTRYSLPNS